MLKLPTPKELNFESNYLTLSNWNNYFKIVKSKYPIKYFILSTIPYLWYKYIRHPLSNLYNYLISRFFYQHHMLNLQQPNNIWQVDHYRYGYLDVPEQMLYAMFNLLNNFVENEMGSYYCPSEEQAKEDPSLYKQRECYFEILRIYDWWNIERKIEYSKIKELENKWYTECIKEENSNLCATFFEELNNLEDFFERKTEAMIIRLIKIRRNLWT
jgi:hypothetical protein